MLRKKNKPPYYEIDDNIRVWEGEWHQYLTDAPTAIVFNNTLGSEIIWTRAGVGEYIGTITGATFGDTFCEYTLNAQDVNSIQKARIVKVNDTQIAIVTSLNATATDYMLGFAYNNLSIRISTKN